jgi:hypothetical protein
MIGYDRLISIAREICKGSLRPTYCKDPETFHPHLWVIEAMKQAYDWGHADATSQTTANLQGFVAECSLVQSEDLSKAKAEIINEIQIQGRSSRSTSNDAIRSRDLESHAEFIVVDGKVVKDRSGLGCWPVGKWSPVQSLAKEAEILEEIGRVATASPAIEESSPTPNARSPLPVGVKDPIECDP